MSLLSNSKFIGFLEGKSMPFKYIFYLRYQWITWNIEYLGGGETKTERDTHVFGGNCAWAYMGGRSASYFFVSSSVLCFFFLNYYVENFIKCIWSYSPFSYVPFKSHPHSYPTYFMFSFFFKSVKYSLCCPYITGSVAITEGGGQPTFSLRLDPSLNLVLTDWLYYLANHLQDSVCLWSPWVATT